MTERSDHDQRIAALEAWRINKEKLDEDRYNHTQGAFTDIKGQLLDTRSHLNRQDAAQEKANGNLEKLVAGQTEIMLKLARQDGAAQATEKFEADEKSTRQFSLTTNIAVLAIIATIFCGFLYLGWSALHH